MTPEIERQTLEAIAHAGRHERDGWAHPTVVAMNLHVARSTAVKRAKALEKKGLVVSREMYGWRYSKSVRSIRFHLTNAGRSTIEGAP